MLIIKVILNPIFFLILLLFLFWIPISKLFRGTIYTVLLKEIHASMHRTLVCICCSNNYYPLMFKDRQVKVNYILYRVFLKVWSILPSICIKIFLLVWLFIGHDSGLWVANIRETILVQIRCNHRCSNHKGDIFREIRILWMNQSYMYLNPITNICVHY